MTKRKSAGATGCFEHLLAAPSRRERQQLCPCGDPVVLVCRTHLVEIEKEAAEGRGYKRWAVKIDKWHTELCEMLGIQPTHPARIDTADINSGDVTLDA